MDVVGVANHNHHGIMKKENHAKKRRSDRHHQKALKVVYISSPMKVKTSASEFRALVQELTGQESDVARRMEVNGVDHHDHDHHGFKHVDGYNNHDDDVRPNNNKDVFPTADASLVGPCRDSPTSSESMLFEPFDDVFARQVMDESFTGLMFPSGFLYESAQADFLRSFDAAV